MRQLSTLYGLTVGGVPALCMDLLPCTACFLHLICITHQAFMAASGNSLLWSTIQCLALAIACAGEQLLGRSPGLSWMPRVP